MHSPCAFLKRNWYDVQWVHCIESRLSQVKAAAMRNRPKGSSQSMKVGGPNQDMLVLGVESLMWVVMVCSYFSRSA